MTAQISHLEGTKQRELLPGTPHAMAADDALVLMGASIATGLASQEVRNRRAQFGPNTIVSRRKVNVLLLLLHQFQSPVVYLLSTAAGLAFLFREFEEGIAVVAVLVVNALIGFLTELKAARSIEALRALGTRSARVRRDGHVRLVPAAEIVPGDIVILEAGDSIVADLRLVDVSGLATDESTLTGESVTVDKHVQPVSADARLFVVAMLHKPETRIRGTVGWVSLALLLVYLFSSYAIYL